MANIFNRRFNTLPWVFKNIPNQRADYPISAWPRVLMPPAEGSVAGLNPWEDTKLDSLRAWASLAAPVFTEEMNRRRHDRGSRDNESTDQTKNEERGQSPLLAVQKRGIQESWKAAGWKGKKASPLTHNPQWTCGVWFLKSVFRWRLGGKLKRDPTFLGSVRTSAVI